MKNLIVTIISSIVVAFSTVYADSHHDLSNVYIQTVKRITLKDGRLINLRTDIKEIRFFNKKIDFIELHSGEIIDRTDIEPLRLYSSSSIVLTKVGVDGGG